MDQKAVSEAVELVLRERTEQRDYCDERHSAEDEAAFERKLHRPAPFEALKMKLFADILKKRK